MSTAPLSSDELRERRLWVKVLRYGWPLFWVANLWSVGWRAAQAGGVRDWIGLAAMLLGSAAAALVVMRSGSRVTHGLPTLDRVTAPGLAVAAACCALAWAVLGIDGMQLVPFLIVALALALPWQQMLVLAIPLTLAVFATEPLRSGWSQGHGMALGCLGAMVGAGLGRQSAERGRVARLMTAHAHELEISEERNRMARDLHDILGHSLTVISLKSELAGKLVDADPAAAKRELTEVQQLARAALADVRATVNNYREISLAGEIARAANTLASAGIKADLPATVEVVDPQLRELFGWVLREAVTNVVRHSGATHCRVTLGEHAIAVSDDGVGISGGGDGHGLEGLRERCRQQGAQLELGPGHGGRGTTLAVHARSADELVAETTNPTMTRTTR